MPIRNRLAIILAERDWTFTRLANESGITKSTLSRLKTNKSKGIEIETMEKLCRTLDVQVGDIWQYVPNTE